jgi:predicted unusual protein kinase regulating ubiquinone biosynthesis (AarF/ABC1/UbiB family)
MADPDKDELIRRLLSDPRAVPASALGRLGRAAATAWRGRRMLGGGDGARALDPAVVEKVVASLGELKGVAMKIGQIMSYIDLAVPDELARALSVLQTHAQPMPPARVREVLARELGARAADLELDDAPIAAASIGQVHRARLRGADVAVKVQYPEIERAIRSDFGPASLGARFASLVYPGARVDAMIGEARARFLEECDYEHEARMQARFAALYAGHPTVRIPEVHASHSTRRVLTTSFMRGVAFDAFLATNPTEELRDRIGITLFEFYIGSLFRHCIYNCDPHPGNYLFDGARIILLDYGCTREFDPAFVARLARLTRAVHRDDPAALHRAFVELGLVRDGKRYDFATARDLVRAFYGPLLVDETRRVDLGAAKSMRDVLHHKRELMKLTLPGELLFLFRIRFGLMSVLARLGARANWLRLEERLSTIHEIDNGYSPT